MNLAVKVLFLLILISTAVFAQDNKLTYENFGHLPLFENATVSPDGKMIAAVYNGEQGPSVVVSDFGGSKVKIVGQLQKSKDRIDGLTWVNNERIVVSVSYPKLYAGRYTRVNRLYALNKDGSNTIILQRKLRNKKSRPEWMDLVSSMRIRSLINDDKEHILIEAYDEKDQGWSVFKVNVYDSDFKKLFVNKYDVSSWYADAKGQVVLGVGYSGSRNHKDTINIWHRKDNDSEWKLLHSREMFNSTTFSPILVNGNKAVVLTDHELYRQAIWSYDIPSGKFEKILYANDKYDVDSAILNPDRTEVIGAVYFDNYRRNHFFDVQDGNIYKTIENSFPNYETTIVDFSEDRKKVLILAERDDSPPKYFWFDREINKAGFWFSKYPSLENKPLAKVQPFEFETSDKMKLNGYLTLPDASIERPPLIVFPHGGPNARDYQYFDPYVQFFASKGYAVLQVNYRGSTGFGNNYETAGYREWGQKMQTDVYEAIDWLKLNDLTDMSKVCMVGASYGGYVALLAAVERPNDYKCIVSIAGLGDIEMLAESEYQYATMRSFIQNTIGNPQNETDLANMRKISPIHSVEKIKAPVLLIHGAKDTRVSIKQSREFNEEAEDADVDIEFVQYKYGTHFLDENENRLSAFKKIGEFLEEHLK